MTTTPRPKKGNQNGDFQGYFRSILFFLNKSGLGIGGGHPFIKMMDDFRIQISKMVVSFRKNILVCISNISLGF